jgi:hypothetical protein
MEILFDYKLLIGIALFPATLVAAKTDAYSRLKSFQGFYRKGREIIASRFPREGLWTWSLYEWISFSGGSLAWLLILAAYTNFSGNILLQRVATGWAAPPPEHNFGSGHYLVWIALFVVYVRFGALDIVKGGLTMAFFGALHELFWYLSYFWVKPMSAPVVLYDYSPFLVLVASILFAYCYLFALKKDSRAEKKRIVVLCLFFGAFYSMWVLAGFPITLDNITGRTVYYHDLVVNAIEDMSWDLAAVVYCTA